MSEIKCADKCGELTVEGSIYCESCKEWNEVYDAFGREKQS